MYKPLSLRDTNVLKGIALLFLLIHHLFYIDNGLYDEVTIAGRGVVQTIGLWSKVCVAIFVFLSGYGLTVQAEKKGGVGDIARFYWRRFTKLMLNYWFIWLIFVPIGVFVFRYSFAEAYGSHTGIKFLLDFIGLINAFGIYGYNVTWWFYSCIILLYILFPFLYRLLKKDTMLSVLVMAVATYLPIPIFASARPYLLTFLAGMIYCSMSNRYTSAGGGKTSHSITLCVLFLMAAFDRLVAPDKLRFDAVIVILMVMSYKFINLPDVTTKALAFLGKHSMNIFLFHTFIYYMWFQDIIYITRNPFVIFLELLASCLLISVLLESIKKLIRFDTLIARIQNINTEKKIKAYVK